MAEPIDYAGPKTPKPVQRWPFWFALGGLAFVAVLVVALMPISQRGHGPYHGNWGKCYHNLRQIGQAMELYSREYGPITPPDLSVLILKEDLTAEIFVCPSSTDTRAEVATIAEAAVASTQPGHASLTYLAAGQVWAQLPADAVVAFDTVANHDAGHNVLVANGQVFAITPADFARVIQPQLDAKAGVVRYPTSEPFYRP